MKRPPVLSVRVARGLAGLTGARGADIVPQARLTGPMPWVLAIMIALVTMAAAGGLALANLADGARAELAGGVTVQVIEAAPAERARQARAALRLLRGDARVAASRLVPDAELEALIAPWLGSAGTNDAAVPIPALIDVRLTGAADAMAVQDLRAKLAVAAPSARIDAQSGWLRPVFDAIASLLWLAGGLVVLLAATSAAAVWLAARSALGGNRGTIEVIHLLGGTDAQIARIFQRSVGVDATLGGAAGLGLGLLAVLTLGRQFAGLGSGMVAGGGLIATDWLLIALIPVAGVILAMLTARLTVLASLRRML